MSIEIKKTNIATWCWATGENLKNAISLWTFFLPQWFMGLLGNIIQIIIFFFMAKEVSDGAASFLKEYGGNYVAYIVLGVAFHQFLWGTMNAYYEAYSMGFWSSTFEFYLTHPVGVTSYMSGRILFTYLTTTLNLLFYLLIGTLGFGINFSGAQFPTAILVLVVSIVSVTGIGLMGASTFTLLHCKQQNNPVSWIVGFAVGLTSGVYFPPSILPNWLVSIGKILPHTYAYEAIRLALLNGASLSDISIQQDLKILLVMTIIILPVGLFLFKHSLRKAEREGLLSRWT